MGPHCAIMVDITKTRLLTLWFSAAASDLKPDELNRMLPVDFIAGQIRRRVTTWLAQDKKVEGSVLGVVSQVVYIFFSPERIIIYLRNY